eukprot:1450626-Alexandrium_andersonii.AAC.1
MGSRPQSCLCRRHTAIPTSSSSRRSPAFGPRLGCASGRGSRLPPPIPPAGSGGRPLWASPPHPRPGGGTAPRR